MTRREKFSAVLYVVTIVASLAFLLFAFARCGGNPKQPPPDVPKLLSCAERVVAIVTDTPDCTDIRRKVDELLQAQAECFEALTGERAIQWTCDTDGGRGR